MSHTENGTDQATIPSNNDTDQATIPSNNDTDQATIPSDNDTDQATIPSDNDTDQATIPSDNDTDQATIPSDNDTDQATIPSDNVSASENPPLSPAQNDASQISAENMAAIQAQENTWPGSAPSYPGYPPLANNNVVGAPPPAPAPGPKAIARALPVWAFILGLLVIVGILIALFVTGSDWADGDLRLSFAATGLAVFLLLLMGIRSVVGMAARNNPHRVRQYVSSILVIIILFTSGGAGLLLHSSLHATQAHFLENQQQWEQALTEYQLAGEKSPTSTELARTYVEWGENLSQNRQYQAANSKFDTVQNNFGPVVDMVQRAQKDEIRSYINWGKQDTTQGHYSNATGRFDYLLGLSYCDSSCKSEVSALDATAYYNQAEAMLKQKNYQEAATDFHVVQDRFPQAPEVNMQHKDMGKALLGKGKQDKSALCETALPVYQELASKFADTPEGQEAKTALSVPQPITGHFVKDVPKLSDGYIIINAALLQNLTSNIGDNDFYQQMANAPTAIIRDDGHFTFQPLKPGTYDLVWGFLRNDGVMLYMFYHSKETNQPIYVAHVGQLCPFDFGDIQDSFMATK